MKNIKITSLLLAGLLTFNSCSDFLDVNKDPNNPAEASTSNILPAAQMSLVGSIGADYAILGGMWSQHWTQSHVAGQYQFVDKYEIRANDYDGNWREMYAGGLNDLEVIKKKAVTDKNNNMLLQATLLQAYGFQFMADLYDEIPFSEALRFPEISAPKYDKGKDIYATLLKRIDEVLGLDFSNSGTVHASSDLVFGTLSKANQIQAWKAFGNTLKLKMYLRQTAVNETEALAKIKTMLDANTEFLTFSDAAVTQFIDEASRSNPLYESNVRQLNVNSNLRLSRTLHSYLNATDDKARLDAYFTAGSAGQQSMVQGNFNELTTKLAPTVPSVSKLTPKDPFYFFSKDEVFFMLAEANARLGSTSKAKMYYESAVKAAYANYGLTVDATKLATGGKIAYPEAGELQAQLKAIMYQKWVAMYKRGCESFWDQARTGYPEISKVSSDDEDKYIPGQWTYSLNGVTQGKFLKRLTFTYFSTSVNSNAPKTIVPVTTNVWWMK